MRVQDYTKRVGGPLHILPLYRQLGIVGQDRLHANKDGLALASEPMHPGEVVR